MTTNSETVRFDGKIIRVVTKPVGNIPAFEIVRHPGAVAVVATDNRYLYLTSQFRPAVGMNVLELPAGLMDDEDDGDPMVTANRELQEETGKGAGSMALLPSFYSSPGFTDERIIMVRAWDLFDSKLEEDEDEDIDVVKWPLDNLDALLDPSGVKGWAMTAKTLIGAAAVREEPV